MKPTTPVPVQDRWFPVCPEGLMWETAKSLVYYDAHDELWHGNVLGYGIVCNPSLKVVARQVEAIERELAA